MVWEGVYKDYSELPDELKSNDHNFEEWVEKQKKRVENISEEIEVIKKRNSFFIEHLKTENEKIKVLDLGGSLGSTFFGVEEYVDEYYIVETEKIVSAGKELAIDKLFFYKDIKDVPAVDIVYIRTSLQYVKSWEKTIEDLVAKAPKTIIFSHLSAGNINTFLTIQNWGERKIPYWFINLEDIKKLFKKHGYKIALKQDADDFREFDKMWEAISKFPKNNRLEKSADIIFIHE